MRRSGFADVLMWQLDRENETPLFRQIHRQLRDAILSRALRPGARLPSTRSLADRLGVARSCVVAAYAELRVEGCLSGRIGSGTCVSADLPEPLQSASRRGPRPLARRHPVPSRARALAALATDLGEGEERPF